MQPTMESNLVSILLPCLNARRFLEPRVESILQQSYENWEAIVIDSFSEDGTWEYFEKLAINDDRFRLHRVPKKGLYAALNYGMDFARGEFLHFATCDDTMLPNFLEMTVDAFRKFPEAGIAATDLLFIDSSGMSDPHSRQESGLVRTARCGEQVHELNYRPVPHDCFLHFCTDTVYFSLTQLLIRRTAAAPSLKFNTATGSSADFDWAMRLCSSTGTVHIPQRLATWRRHGDQLSLVHDVARDLFIADYCNSFAEMYVDNEAERAALLIPARRKALGRSPNRWKLVGLYCEVMGFTAIRLLESPTKVHKALMNAGWTCGRFREAWVGFLILLKGVRHLNQESMPPKGPGASSS